MHADEAGRVEDPLEFLHRAAQHVSLARRVNTQVVARRVDPEDVCHVDTGRGPAVLDGQPLRMTRRRVGPALERLFQRQLLARQVADQLQQTGAMPHCLANVELFPRPFDSGVEPRFVDGLEQIVERIRLEGANRVFGVRRDEYDHRHLGTSHMPEHVETVHPRHLDIEEHDVGFEPHDVVQRFPAIATVATYLDVRRGLEPYLQAAAGQFFVIDNQDAQLTHWSRTGG